MEANNRKRMRPISYNNDDKEILQDLGRRIHHLRIAKKLTQSELARLSGVHKNFICIVENGVQNPSFMCLYHIAKALNVTLYELFRGDM